MAYSYDSSNYDPNKKPEYSLIPVGDHRVRIANAEIKTSKNGNEFLNLTLDVSGTRSHLWYRIMLLCDTAERKAQTDQRVGAFLAAFAIPAFDLNAMKGKTGAVHVKHSTYNGTESAEVAYPLYREKLAELPAWVEPENNGSTGSTSGGYSYTPPAATASQNAVYDSFPMDISELNNTLPPYQGQETDIPF